jgi:N-acetylneuraminic acid mutarotase
VRRGVAIIAVAVLAAGCGGSGSGSTPGWHELAPLLHGRSAHAVVSDRDTVYALAGTGADGSPTRMVERFDGRVWSEETTLPGGGLNAPAAALLHGKLYLIGGFEAATNVPTDRMHVYDTKTRKWSELPPMPAPRGGHAAAALGGNVHVVGGGDQISTLAYHSVYEPATGNWRELAPLPSARGSLAAVVVDGKLWAIGGRSGNRDVGDVDVYDPATDTWSQGPSIPPRGTHGAVHFRGAIHVFGGESQSEGSVLGAVLRLDPKTREWEQVSSMPTARSYARAVLHDEGVVVVGGSAEPGDSHASSGSKAVERFGPGQ